MVVLTGVGLLVALVALALTLENAHYSHGGRVPFHFSYRGLYRTTPDPGGYVRVAGARRRRRAEVLLRGGSAATAALLGRAAGRAAAVRDRLHPQAAAALCRTSSCGARARRGSTDLPAYQVLYTARVDGETVYGRDVLLLPPRAGAREGVEIVMLELHHGHSADRLAAGSRRHRRAAEAAEDLHVRLAAAAPAGYCAATVSAEALASRRRSLRRRHGARPGGVCRRWVRCARRACLRRRASAVAWGWARAPVRRWAAMRAAQERVRWLWRRAAFRALGCRWWSWRRWGAAWSRW